MNSRLVRSLLVGSCAAAAVALTAATATAAPTFTVKAGSAPSGTAVAITGVTTGTSPQVTFVDTTTNTTLNCVSSSIPGSTVVGTGKSGTAIAKITGSKAVFTNCTGPFGLTFTVAGQRTWKLNATSGSATGASGKIVGVNATVSDPGTCSFAVSGSVAVKYLNSTTSLTAPGTSSGLTIASVPSGQCFGAINNGDKASFGATYKVTANVAADNPVTITSP